MKTLIVLASFLLTASLAEAGCGGRAAGRLAIFRPFAAVRHRAEARAEVRASFVRPVAVSTVAWTPPSVLAGVNCPCVVAMGSCPCVSPQGNPSSWTPPNVNQTVPQQMPKTLTPKTMKLVNGVWYVCDENGCFRK